MSGQSNNSMDEVQFNASLDALLAGESLTGNESGSPSCNTYPILNSPLANGWVNTSGAAGIAFAMNLHQPVENRGTASVSQNASNSHATSAFPPTTYYTPYLSYGSVANQDQSGSQSVSSFGDAISVASSRSGRRSVKTKPRSGGITRTGKQGRDASAVSEDEGERHRRREDRNMREQQRSQKITEQIEHLRDVLVSANVQFKPDKYSTLVTAAEYIQKLQERSAMLDVEHKKLVDTISRTNEMVNEQYIPASTAGVRPPGCAASTIEGTASGDIDQKDSLYLASIDYKAIFDKCGVPLAVLSIDGRFLECNHVFERLTGYTREELLPTQKVDVDKVHSSIGVEMTALDNTDLKPPAPRNMSLFNLLSREHMENVFMAMSEMLRQSPDEIMARAASTTNKDFWSGVVALARNTELQVSYVITC
jgi:PAS domain-containing protein